jgi:hypothetical protein
MVRKWFVSVGTLIIIALLTMGCANPEAEYKTQLQDALLKYDQWNQGSVVAFNKLQDEKTTGNPDVTYGQLITNTIQSHNSGDTRRADLTWNRADFDAVKGQAQMVYDGARPLLTALEKMTPTDKMKDPHLILQECVKYQMNIAATILIFLNDNKFEPVNYSTNPCQDMDLALAALRQYAEKK